MINTETGLYTGQLRDISYLKKKKIGLKTDEKKNRLKLPPIETARVARGIARITVRARVIKIRVTNVAKKKKKL